MVPGNPGTDLGGAGLAASGESAGIGMKILRVPGQVARPVQGVTISTDKECKP